MLFTCRRPTTTTSVLRCTAPLHRSLQGLETRVDDSCGLLASPCRLLHRDVPLCTHDISTSGPCLIDAHDAACRCCGTTHAGVADGTECVIELAAAGIVAAGVAAAAAAATGARYEMIAEVVGDSRRRCCCWRCRPGEAFGAAEERGRDGCSTKTLS
eukprot:COSAG01_NODE_2665_length_7288_cov_30.045208_8_plen_157_part_00